MCVLEEKKENGTNGSETQPAVEKMVSMTSTELGRKELDIQCLTDQVKSLERRNADLEKQHLIMQCFHANEGIYNKYMVFKHSIDGADWQQLWNDKYSKMQFNNTKTADSSNNDYIFYDRMINKELLSIYDEAEELISGFGMKEIIQSITEMLYDYQYKYNNEEPIDLIHAAEQREDLQNRTQTSLMLMKMLSSIESSVQYIANQKDKGKRNLISIRKSTSRNDENL